MSSADARRWRRCQNRNLRRVITRGNSRHRAAGLSMRKIMVTAYAESMPVITRRSRWATNSGKLRYRRPR